MKKGFLFLIPLLCLTGCEDGKKTLTCERTGDFSETEVIKLSYNKKNELLGAEFITSYSIEEEYEKELLVPLLEAECKTMNGSKGITCKIQEKKESVSLEIKMEFSKISDVDQKDMEDMKIYDEALETLESEGYVCK